MFLNSISVTSNKDKANLFNEYFHSVFSSTSFTLPPLSTVSTPNKVIEDLVISEPETFQALTSFDPSKAPGLDGIGSNLLKYCAVAICSPFHHLFTQCLSQQNIPSEWKIHCITPIHKSGERALINNYRPISLLSCSSKVLERIVYDKIIDFLTDSVINRHQFGFLTNRSSTQQLLILLNSIHNSHQCHASTDVIYLDFRKAFDKVSHPELLLKLWTSGITGNLWLWFKAYLSNRQQCVSIDGVPSSFVTVLSGVPQGSILGPLLFLIYINDLPLSITSSRALLYADDTNCLLGINSPLDSQNLQTDLDTVGAWGSEWNMLFNEGKCVHVMFSSNYESRNPFQYSINGSTITTCDHHRDLGVIMSNDLSWSRHCEYIVSKAYRTLGMIRRAFKTSSIPAKRKLYLSLVRSRLSYCSPVWRPQHARDIISLERVQRRATKYILNDYTSDYKSRLLSLHLLPLMYYFELCDLMFFIKNIKHPSECFNIKDYITFSNCSTRSSAHYKLRHNQTATSSYRHFYFNRIVRLWNSLPPIDIASPLSSIRSNISNLLWSHFESHFDPSLICTFHFKCPCSKCLHSFYPSNFKHF